MHIVLDTFAGCQHCACCIPVHVGPSQECRWSPDCCLQVGYARHSCPKQKHMEADTGIHTSCGGAFCLLAALHGSHPRQHISNVRYRPVYPNADLSEPGANVFWCFFVNREDFAHEQLFHTASDHPHQLSTAVIINRSTGAYTSLGVDACSKNKILTHCAWQETKVRGTKSGLVSELRLRLNAPRSQRNDKNS